MIFGEKEMSLLTRLTISIGLLAGLVTWVFVGPLSALNVQVWAIFIAWASYYHSGGTSKALQSNIPCHIFGALVGWVALILITIYSQQLGIAGIAGIAVFLGAVVIVQFSKFNLLSNIPSAFYGFATIAGYSFLAGKLDQLYTPAPLENPLSVTIISLCLGAVIGWLSESLAVTLESKTQERTT